MFSHPRVLITVLVAAVVGKTRGEQRWMVEQYVNHAVDRYHGFDGTGSFRGPTPSMSGLFRDLYYRVDKIHLCCSSRHAAVPPYVSFEICTLAPCGTLSTLSEGIFRMRWELRVPIPFFINITVLGVSSEWDGNGCVFAPFLRLPTRRRPSFIEYSPDSILICGKSPLQTFYSPNYMQPVIWQCPRSYREQSYFLLSYQAFSPGYVQYSHTDSYELWSDDLRSCSENTVQSGADLIRLILQSERDIYAWYSAGSVLMTPVLKIRHFRCINERDRDEGNLGQLIVYDAPFLPRDPIYNGVDISPKISFQCSHTALSETHTSSVGDMTLLVIINKPIEFVLEANLTYVYVKCPGIFCSMTSLKIFPSRFTRFAVPALSLTTQQRLVLEPQLTNRSGLVISDLTVQFEGFTHLLCAMGGIYIYELAQAPSLIGQICSSLASKTWTGAVRQADGDIRLYLNHKSLLFVVKSYKGLTKGRISGRATLSDTCMGIVHSPPSFSVPRTSAKKESNGKSCLRQQYIHSDGFKPWVSRGHPYLSLAMPNLTNKETGQVQNVYNIRAVRNKSAFPTGIVNSHLPYVYNLEVFSSYSCNLVVKTGQVVGLGEYPYRTLPFGDEMFVFTVLSSGSLDTRFDLYCLRYGFRVLIEAARGPADAKVCWSSERLIQDMDLSFSKDHYIIIPSVLCAALSLTKIDVSGAWSLLFVFSRPLSQNPKHICCALKLSLSLSSSFYPSVSDIDLLEPTGHIHYRQKALVTGGSAEMVSQSWYCKDGTHCYWLKTGASNSSEFETEMLTLSRMWSYLNALRGMVEVEINRDVTTPCHPVLQCGEPTLELVFNHSLYPVQWKHQKSKYSTQNSHQGNIYFYSISDTYYLFTVRRNLSWQASFNECLSRGMDLVSTPSDVEWRQVSSLIAQERDLMLLAQYAQLAYLGLQVKTVSHNDP